MLERSSYLRDGAAIYERSFAIIREEADLARFAADEADVAVRMIHAAGQVEIAGSIEFAPELVSTARAALKGGAPILCDAEMLAHGITRARLPAKNEVICTLRDPHVPELASKLGTTRSAAALELWRNKLSGAVVAIGNAPTALYRLASSARLNPRRRLPPIRAGFLILPCEVASAAARLRRRQSTRSPRRGYDRAFHRCRCWAWRSRLAHAERHRRA
jgi:precorrin isomerase